MSYLIIDGRLCEMRSPDNQNFFEKLYAEKSESSYSVVKRKKVSNDYIESLLKQYDLDDMRRYLEGNWEIDKKPRYGESVSTESKISKAEFIRKNG